MRGGKRGSQRGRERVFAENEEDIIARNMMGSNGGRNRWNDNGNDSSDANESDSEPEVTRRGRRAVREMSDSSSDSDDDFMNGNLNRGNRARSSNGPLQVEISGKQKRELEKEKAKEAYFQKTLEGKTPEAKATLERLARIRAQREEAARRRKEEEAAKAAIEERVKEQARLKNAAMKK